MNLLEVLLGGVLFLGASAASLLVWSQAVEAIAADARRLEALDGLEAELRAAEIRLLDPGLLASPAVACGELTGRLAAALEREPPVAGVVRQLHWPAAGEPLRLQVMAGDQRRERSYTPSAFGGCNPAPAGVPVAPPVAATAAPVVAVLESHGTP